MTDSEIIKGIKNNSEAAWREAYMQMKPGIKMQVMPLLKDVVDVTFDDVFEEGLIILMENVKDGKIDENGSNNLSGYLYTICRRIALKHYKKKPLMIVVEEKVDPADHGDIDPDVLMEQDREAREFLDRVLNSIPENCKKILKRFYWDHMPMDMIAAMMGLKNANTAKTTKNRCMDKFKDIAKKMLADDEKAEVAVQRSVERAALRDLFEQLRQEEDGSLAMAACKEKDKKDN